MNMWRWMRARIERRGRGRRDAEIAREIENHLELEAEERRLGRCLE